MKHSVKARAPLRLGLAGGGTDVSPYCDTYGGCILNATINRYAYAIIKPLEGPNVEFIAADQQIKLVCPIDAPFPLQGTLPLHTSVYDYIIKNYHNHAPIPLELTTFCDAPAGSGLGSSSTLVVAMVRAFVELLNLPLDDYAVAQLSYKIEREICDLQGGRQDQYSATFGGFNFMEFNKEDTVIISPLRIKNWIMCELEASLILYHTGISRESARIISDQSNNVLSGFTDRIEAMHNIKREAIIMKNCLLCGDFDGIVQSLEDGWNAKKQSAETVTNSNIDAIYENAIQAGALAGKVSGAGGGGFMLFFVKSEKRMDVIRTLEQFGGQVSNCHFAKNGAQAWKF